MGSNGWRNCVDAEGFTGLQTQMHSSLYGMNTDSPYFLDLQCEKDFLEAFRHCSPLKAIISKKAKAFNTGKRKVLNKNTNNPGAGPEAKRLRELIEKPNILQNGDQFFAQQNIYIDLFGYCPILRIPTPGMEDEISSIWNIPPWLFDIEYTKKWLMQTTIEGIYAKYFVEWNGERKEIDMSQMKFIFDDGIGTECDTNLTIPDSRLIGNSYVVSNIIAAYKTRNTLITKRGAIGILSNEAKDAVGQPLPVNDGVRKSVQNDFKKYGLVGQAYQIIISDAKLKWQQMGFATKDLMLFEEIQDDIERLCDAFGWPVELIARGKDITYDNKRQARKDCYHNTIIPEGESRMQQFTTCVVAKDSAMKVIVDYSEVSVLQEEMKEKAESRDTMNDACQKEWDAGLITKNDWLESLGRERMLNKPEFDMLKAEYDAEMAKKNPQPPVPPIEETEEE